MSRAPLLTSKVISSLEEILADFKPADYLGTDKEAGIKYLTALAKHSHNPKTLAARRKVVAASKAWRETNT